MEVSSASTHWQDQFRGYGLYRNPGVQENWIHKPLGGHLETRLPGLRKEVGR